MESAPEGQADGLGEVDLFRWSKEEKLEEVRYFRRDDRPAHRALSEVELFDTRDSILRGGRAGELAAGGAQRLALLQEALKLKNLSALREALPWSRPRGKPSPDYLRGLRSHR